MSSPKVIGYGTYGCVTKPRLSCKTTLKKKIPNSTVSKLLHKDDALEEMNEMKKISKIKNIDEYILQQPVQCAPKQDENFKKAFEECQGLSYYLYKYRDQPENLRLLLMEDGGVNVEDYLENFLEKETYSNQCLFFSSLLKLIQGLAFFRKNNIMHYDIKMKNIVYNVNTGSIKYIDFGMATTLSKRIIESKNNTNKMARSHTYYPPETSCSNEKDFIKSDSCKQYRDFFTYNQFIQKAVNTFDSYCLAFDLDNLVDYLMSHNQSFPKVSPEFLQKAKSLIQEFCAKDLAKRNDNLDVWYSYMKELLVQYKLYKTGKPTPSKEILEKSKSWSHRVQSQSPTVSPVMTKPVKRVQVKSAESQLKTIKARRVAAAKKKKKIKVSKKAKAKEKVKRCPVGYIRNSITKRCRKKLKQ